MIRTIPKKKKCKKAQWLSEEALEIAMKRREVKGKREKERYTHLNAKVKNIIISPYDYTVEVTNRFQGLDLIDRVSEEL